MTDFIATLSPEGTDWGQVKKLVEEGQFEKHFLITTIDASKKFEYEKTKEVRFVIIDAKKPVQEVINDIVKQMRGKIGFGEVGINLVSGSGKEHMAILSALMKLGYGYRLVAATKEGIVEL